MRARAAGRWRFVPMQNRIDHHEPIASNRAHEVAARPPARRRGARPASAGRGTGRPTTRGRLPVPRRAGRPVCRARLTAPLRRSADLRPAARSEPRGHGCLRHAPPRRSDARPRLPRRVRRPGELVSALGLDPEPDMSPVGEPGVVGTAPARAQPASLEQRADHVATVTHDMKQGRPRQSERRGARDEGCLGGLLDRTEVADERESSGDAESVTDTRCGSFRGRSISVGMAAFSAATSPRSTNPGTDPTARARKVVPERGLPRTKTMRSSSGPERPAQRRTAAAYDPPGRPQLKRRRPKRILHGAIVSRP